MHIERDHEGNTKNVTIGPYRESKEDILRLQDLSYIRQPNTLNITAEGLELHNVEVLTQVLYHFSKRDLTWKSISFDEKVGHLSTEPLQNLMETVNSLQLCQELRVSIQHSRNFFDNDWGHAMPKLSSNHRLEVLRIESNFNKLSSTDQKELCHLVRISAKLRDLSLHFTKVDDFEVFLNALVQNQSLRCLHLSLPSCDTNPLISKLADIIQKHPALHSLAINTEYVSDKLREGIVDLLQCSRLQMLSITGNGSGSREYSLPILKALKSHSSLKKISLPDLDGVNYSEILKVVLPKSMLRLFSVGNQITIDEHCEQEIASLPKRMQFLRLEQRRTDDYWTHKELFEQLLIHHPGLYLIKPFGSLLPSRRIEFFNELNWYGQFVHGGNQSFPFSHWPQLLYRVSSNPNGIFDPSRYPSVVFELLRSAEFLGKGGFEQVVESQSRKRKLRNSVEGHS